MAADHDLAGVFDGRPDEDVEARRRQEMPNGKDVGGRARTCRGDYLACCPGAQFTRDQRDDDDHE